MIHELLGFLKIFILDSVMCFVRVILYYVGCMFVASSLNRF